MAQIEVTFAVVADLAAGYAERAGALVRLAHVPLPALHGPVRSARAVARLAGRVQARVAELADVHECVRAGLVDGLDRYRGLEGS